MGSVKLQNNHSIEAPMIGPLKSVGNSAYPSMLML